MRAVKSDQSTVRALNRRLILNHIRQSGAVSRVQLVELTGLSPAAVTTVTAELISDQFLLERAMGESSGGRPPILLDIDFDAHYAIGLKLMEDQIIAVLTDLSTQVIAQDSIRLEHHEPNYVADCALKVSRSLLKRNNAKLERLIGLGLGLAGVVDASSGVCLSSPFLGWNHVPIAEFIRSKIGASVWIDNDVNAFAAAERLFGHGKRSQNFVVVTFGRGIGAGLVLGGEIYRGRDGGAGEFGHTLCEADGRRCECGNYGCLEAYASEPALVARYNALVSKKNALKDIHGLLEKVNQSDKNAVALLEDAGQRVGRALANLVNLLNPDLIVIGGEGVRLGETFFAPMRQTMLEHVFNGLALDLPIFIDAWGDDAWARGAASLAVQRAFDFGSI